MTSYLFSVSDFDEECLQLQRFYKKSPADSLVELRSQAGVGQPGRTQSQDLAECAHRLRHSLPLLVLLFLLFVLAAVPLICCTVPGGAAVLSTLLAPHHAFDELLQLRAELPLLAVVQSPVQGSVDGHSQRLDQLQKDEETII